MWLHIKDGDPVARELFRRHYSYRKNRDQMSFFPEKNRNWLLFVGPGEKTVLLTEDAKALFVWRKFISMDKQDGVSCAVFRNEGSNAGRASDLIRAANEDRLATLAGSPAVHVCRCSAGSAQAGPWPMLPEGWLRQMRGIERRTADSGGIPARASSP